MLRTFRCAVHPIRAGPVREVFDCTNISTFRYVVPVGRACCGMLLYHITMYHRTPPEVPVRETAGSHRVGANPYGLTGRTLSRQGRWSWRCPSRTWLKIRSVRDLRAVGLTYLSEFCLLNISDILARNTRCSRVKAIPVQMPSMSRQERTDRDSVISRLERTSTR